MPDLTSEVDIWEDCMKEEKRTAPLLRMPKSPSNLLPLVLIRKDLYCKGRSAREVGPDR